MTKCNACPKVTRSFTISELQNLEYISENFIFLNEFVQKNVFDMAKFS